MSPSAPAPAGYRERLTPAWWITVSALVVAIGFGLAFARLSDLAGLVAFVVTAAVLLLLLQRSTPVLEVAGGTLRAGRARVPVTVLGQVDVLEGEAMRRATGPGLDARAFLCLRGWIPTGVRVALTDPADPTPYWLISTRHPQELADAIRSSRS